MTTNYPTSQDSFPRPTASSALTGHASLHDDIADAVESIQSVVGVTGDTTAGTVQKRLSDLETAPAPPAPSNLVEFFERTTSWMDNDTTLHTFTFASELNCVYELTFFARVYMLQDKYIRIQVRDGSDNELQNFRVIDQADYGNQNTLVGIYMFRGTGSSMTIKLHYYEFGTDNYLIGGTTAPIQAMIKRVGA